MIKYFKAFRSRQHYHDAALCASLPGVFEGRNWCFRESWLQFDYIWGK